MCKKETSAFLRTKMWAVLPLEQLLAYAGGKGKWAASAKGIQRKKGETSRYVEGGGGVEGEKTDDLRGFGEADARLERHGRLYIQKLGEACSEDRVRTGKKKRLTYRLCPARAELGPAAEEKQGIRPAGGIRVCYLREDPPLAKERRCAGMYASRL